MHTTKLKPIINLVSLNREFIRTVAVASTTVKTPTINENLKSWKEIPGPSSLPIIGIMHHFLPGGPLYNTNNLEVTRKIFDIYGPIVRMEGILGAPTMIMLFDPDCCEQVFRGENWMPTRPGFHTLEHYRKRYKKKKENDVNFTGLVTDHGDLWKNFRSTVNPVMLQPKTIKLYSKVLEEVANDMIARLRFLRDEKNAVRGNFDIEMNLWALESIGTVALGCRLNCIDSNLPEDSPQKQLIHCVHDIFKLADQLDFKPSLWRYISTPKYKKVMKLYELQENLTKLFVKKGIEEFRKTKKSDHEKGILEKLFEINEDVALIMASDMLFAGVDTAANTMSAAFYMLATNPEKQEKLREELRSTQDRSQYLRACIKESMRVMPVISGNIRLTSKEYNILGYKIPKDMHVAFSHYDMSFMESQFPNARAYIPERWLAVKDDPLYYRNAHPFAYLPFGYGARGCIGRRIAELEIETFLTKVIENFRIEWIGPPPKVVQSSLNYIKGPFHFVFNDVK